MKKTQILNNTATVEERSLGALQYWLKYGKHSWALGATIFFLPYGLIMMAITIATYIFIPYMLWHLYKAKWYKSVLSLIVVVILPFLISHFAPIENSITNYIFSFIPFITFFFFCYTISYMIGERIRDIGTLKKMEKRRTN